VICDFCRRRPQQADFTICKPCHDASHREHDLPRRFASIHLVLVDLAQGLRGFNPGVRRAASQDLAERYPGLTVQRALWMLAADEGYGTCGHCGRLARLDERHRCEGNHLVMLSSSAPEDVDALLKYRDTPRMREMTR
jgi:hypothetical protein